MEEKPPRERKRVLTRMEEPRAADMMTKEESIRASKMPESQKIEALMAIGAIEKPANPVGRVSFKVYAKVKNIDPKYHRAMLAYPSVQGVELATLEEWAQKLKGF